MRKPIFIVLVATLSVLSALTGCRSRNTESPDVIPRAEMIRLMTEMEVTESALRYRQSRVSADSIKKLSQRSYDSLYASYGYSPVRFRTSLEYYQKNLEDYQQMLDEVIQRLTREKDSVNLTPEDRVDTTAAGRELLRK